MERANLEAPDISCDHCIQTIRTSVEKLSGVQFISGDPDVKQVVVEYDPGQTALDGIEAAMEEEGYPVRK